MKTGIEKVYYAAQDPKTYLVTVLSDQVAPEEFCIEMAKRNHISALLPVQNRIMNGATELLFDITGKSRVIDVFRSLGDAKAMTFVLLGCCKSLMELYDYFLHPAQCILDVDYIFIGDKQQVCFALVPISAEATESGNELKQMFFDLVGACPAITNTDKTEILGYLIQPNFSLQELRSLLERCLGLAKEDIKAGAVHSDEFLRPVAPSMPLRTPELAENSGSKENEAKEYATKDAESKETGAKEIHIPGGGKFVIPTVNKESDKKAEKKEKQKTPKDSKKLFDGLFSKKKKESIDLNIEAHQVRGGAVTHSPVRENPVPDGQDQHGEWRGTIQLLPADLEGKTVFDNEPSGPKRLILVHNGHQIPVVSFPFTVGRELCSYIINNLKVSRQHITISFEDGTFKVTDNNSSNHTYCNNAMLAPFTAYDLTDGAELRLGNEIILISIK